METSASSASPAEQLGFEASAMFSFMSDKMIELRNHVWSAPLSDPTLHPINADGAVLARVIDFQNTVAERFADAQGSGRGHRSLP